MKRFFFVWLALAFLTGCGEDTPATESGTVAESVEPSGPPAGTWISGDLHTHTTYSDDAKKQGGDSVETLVALAADIGLEFLAITDHRTLDQIQDPAFSSGSVVLIRGEEWGTFGHAGALGIAEPVPIIDESQGPETFDAQVQAAIAACQAQGGVWTINHPTRNDSSWVWSVEGAAGVEIWNSFWALRAKGLTAEMLAEESAAALGTAVAPVNPALTDVLPSADLGANHQALRYWEGLLNQGYRLAAVGGSDRHMLVLPGHPTTRVFASAPTEPAILAGLQAGRTYVTYKPDGPGLFLEADAEGDGIYETIVGGEVPAGTVRLRVRVDRTVGGKIRIVKNGKVVTSIAVGKSGIVEWKDQAGPGDWYRADLLEPAETPDLFAKAWKSLVMSQSFLDPDPASLQFYLDILYLAASLPGVGLDWSHGTTLPLLILREDFLRLANLALDDPAWCRAAITSPIYVAGP